FCGVLILMYQNNADAHGNAKNPGDLRMACLILFGTICYGFSVNYVKNKLPHIKALILSAVSFTIICAPACIFLIATAAWGALISKPVYGISLSSVLILSLVGTVLSSIFFYDLVQKTNAVFASTVAYLMPVVSTLWGIVDGEVLTILYFFSLALILAGVYISRK